MFLIDDLLALPFRGFFGIFRKIQEMADRELTDEEYIQERLLELQLLYEMDEIGEEEYHVRAQEWEEKLNAVRQAEDEVPPEGGEAAAGPGVTGRGDALMETRHAA